MSGWKTKFRSFFKKKKARPKNSKNGACYFENIEDCPYFTQEDCPDKKRNCHHSENNQRAVRVWVWKKLIWWIIVASACIAISSAYIKSDYPKVHELICGVSMSIIAGVVISLIIDLPKSLRRNEESILNALSSDGYIKKLNNEKLRGLRDKITELLYKKDAPKLPKGLIDMDRKICELLMDPYFDYYSRKDICKIVDRPNGKTYLEKRVNISYKLVNPQGGLQEQRDKVAMNSSMCIADDDDINDLIKINKVQVTIDQQAPFDLKDSIELYKDNHVGMNNYNCRVYWSRSRDTLNPHTFVFRDSIAVEMSYVVLLPVTDIWHTTKLRYAAKNYHLDCSYNNPEIQIYGQVMGTLIENVDFSVNNIDNNNITIDVHNWLLPKNGTIYVFGPVSD